MGENEIPAPPPPDDSGMQMPPMGNGFPDLPGGPLSSGPSRNFSSSQQGDKTLSNQLNDQLGKINELAGSIKAREEIFNQDRNTLLQLLQSREEENRILKDQLNKQQLESSSRVVDAQKAWERREEELKSMQQHTLSELNGLEQKLQSERDQAWQMMLKAKEEENNSLRVELTIQEAKLKASSEKQGQSLQDVSQQAEHAIREHEAQLRIEKERWLEILRSKEEEYQDLKAEINSREQAVRFNLAKKEEELQEFIKRAQGESDEKERKIWNERQAWLKAFKEQLAVREARIKEENDKREREIRDEQLRLRNELEERESRFIEEKNHWAELIRIRDDEINRMKLELKEFQMELRNTLKQREDEQLRVQAVIAEQVESEREIWQDRLRASEQEHLQQLDGMNQRMESLKSEREEEAGRLRDEITRRETNFKEELEKHISAEESVWQSRFQQVVSENESIRTSSMSRIEAEKQRGIEEIQRRESEINSLRMEIDLMKQSQQTDWDERLDSERGQWQSRLNSKEEELIFVRAEMEQLQIALESKLRQKEEEARVLKEDFEKQKTAWEQEAGQTDHKIGQVIREWQKKMEEERRTWQVRLENELEIRQQREQERQSQERRQNQLWSERENEWRELRQAAIDRETELQSEISALRTQLEELRHRLLAVQQKHQDDLTQSRESWQMEKAQLQENIAVKEREIEKRSNEIEQSRYALEEQLKIKEKDFQQKEMLLRENNDEIRKKAEEQYIRMNNQFNLREQELMAAVRQHQQSKEILEETLASEKGKRQGAEEALISLRQQLQLQRNDFEKEMEEWRHRMMMREREKSGLEEEIDKLQHQFRGEQSRREKLEQDLVLREEDIARINSQLRYQQAVQAESEKKYQQQIQVYQAAHSAGEQRLAEVNGQIIQMREQLSMQIQQWHAERQSLENAIREQEEEQRRMEQEAARREMELTEQMNSEVQSLQHGLLDRQKEAEQIRRSSMAEIERERAAAVNREIDLKDEWNKRIAREKEIFEKNKNDWNNNIEKLENQILRLNDALKLKDGEIQATRQEFDVARQKASGKEKNLQSSLDELSLEIVELKQRCRFWLWLTRG